MKRMLILGVLSACLMSGCWAPPDHRGHHYRGPSHHRHRTVRDVGETWDTDIDAEWDEETVPVEIPEAVPEPPKITPTDGNVKSVTGGAVDFVRSADVTVLEWTASWCGPCQSLKPKLAAMAKEFADSGVVFGSADYDALKAEADGVATLPRTRVYKGGVMTAEIEGDKEEEIRKAVRDALGSAE